MATTPKFTYIDVAEVKKSRRGKTANTDPELVEALAKLPVGKAIPFRTIKGWVAMSDEQKSKERTSLRAEVARNWSAAYPDGQKFSVNFSDVGLAQISHKITASDSE